MIRRYAFLNADLVNVGEYKFEPLITLQHTKCYHTPFSILAYVSRMFQQHLSFFAKFDDTRVFRS